jgi:peptidoglycan L-alanyl-D-glutamate endopeptidase CwlK
MNSFSKRSKQNLSECDNRLQSVFNEVIKRFDCTVMCGYRPEEEQNEKFRTGMSKKKYPNSKHNSLPSSAVDVAPYPINWKDRERFTLFAGVVIGVGTMMGYNIRWGGDWNMDTQVTDNDFDDLPHFEIIGNL